MQRASNLALLHQQHILPDGPQRRIDQIQAKPSERRDFEQHQGCHLRPVQEDRLQAHKQVGDIPALQRGRPRPGERPELLQENWTPSTRLLTGAAGGALVTYGLQRRDLGGALGLAGLALLGRAVTNTELRRLTGVAGGRSAVDIQKPITINAPPAGVLGYTVAALFGVDPKRQMDDDLVRLKSLPEEGKASAGHQTVHRNELGVGGASLTDEPAR
jgi:hypothetical protein